MSATIQTASAGKPTLHLKFPPKSIATPARAPVVKPEPQPKPHVAEPPKLPSKADRKRKALMHMRAFLTHNFPKCFRPFGQPKLPLKIGVYDDVMAIYGKSNGGFKWTLMGALRDYCGGESYLRAMVPGAVRVDLDGNAAGTVTEEQANFALARLAEWGAKS
jgi:sRNA-binding protein